MRFIDQVFIRGSTFLIHRYLALGYDVYDVDRSSTANYGMYDSVGQVTVSDMLGIKEIISVIAVTVSIIAIIMSAGGMIYNHQNPNVRAEEKKRIERNLLIIILIGAVVAFIALIYSIRLKVH